MLRDCPNSDHVFKDFSVSLSSL